MLKILPTELPEVLVLEYEPRQDSRGLSWCTFSRRELEQAGVNADFVEENVYNPEKAGTLYGIHFQNHPMAQAKLLYCTRGRGLDYAVDLRKDAPTYRRWVCVPLCADDHRQVYIPQGFGHAFLSLEDHTSVVLRIDRYFHSEYRRGIAWDDPDIGIRYPIERPILAEHDRSAPLLRDSDCNL